ncbi:MAG: hypothetical protein AAFQ80_15145 [Cyanobacteria bacterium J06621_8]
MTVQNQESTVNNQEVNNMTNNPEVSAVNDGAQVLEVREYTITVLVNKRREEGNITFSVSQGEENDEFQSTNITGSVVEAEGLIHTEDRGAEYDYSKDIKGLEALIIVDDMGLAEEVISKAQEIFDSRLVKGNANNRVYLSIRATGFSLDLKDLALETEENRSKVWIKNVISIDVSGGLSINAFQERLKALKARSNSRTNRVKPRSSGMFTPQTVTAKQSAVVANSTVATTVTSKSPTKEELQQQMVQMQAAMTQLQEQLAAAQASTTAPGVANTETVEVTASTAS